MFTIILGFADNTQRCSLSRGLQQAVLSGRQSMAGCTCHPPDGAVRLTTKVVDSDSDEGASPARTAAADLQGQHSQGMWRTDGRWTPLREQMNYHRWRMRLTSSATLT